MRPILEKFDEDKLLKYKATYLGAFLNDMYLIGRRHRLPTYGHDYVSNIRYIWTTQSSLVMSFIFNFDVIFVKRYDVLCDLLFN